MEARRGARLPDRDGRRDHVRAVPDHGAGGGRRAGRRPHRGRARDRLGGAPRAGERDRHSPRALDARLHGPRGGARRGLLPSPPRHHARSRQGDRPRAPRAGAARPVRVGRALRRRDAAGLAPPGDARPYGARAARLLQARPRPRRRPTRWRSSSSIRARARGCWTSPRSCLPRPTARPTSGRRASPTRGRRSERTDDERDPSAADHRRALPHRRDPAVEVLRPRAPGEADGLRLPLARGVRQEPHGRVQDRARARDVQLRRPDPRDLLRPQRRGHGGGDDQRPHPGRRSGSRSCRATRR